MKTLRILLIDDDRVTGLTLEHYFDENAAHFQTVLLIYFQDFSGDSQAHFQTSFIILACVISDLRSIFDQARCRHHS